MVKELEKLSWRGTITPSIGRNETAEVYGYRAHVFHEDGGWKVIIVRRTGATLPPTHAAARGLGSKDEALAIAEFGLSFPGECRGNNLKRAAEDYYHRRNLARGSAELERSRAEYARQQRGEDD